jgi:hypothetical protein
LLGLDIVPGDYDGMNKLIEELDEKQLHQRLLDEDATSPWKP